MAVPRLVVHLLWYFGVCALTEQRTAPTAQQLEPGLGKCSLSPGSTASCVVRRYSHLTNFQGS